MSSARAAPSRIAHAPCLHYYQPPDAQAMRIKVYLFPYAGGSAGVFRDWPSHFDPDFHLVGIQLPGRGSRILAAPETDYRVLVRDISDAILADKQDCRFVLYGHSMGALLAYEVAHELLRRGTAQAEALFVSGRKPPHLPMERKPVAHMSDAQFLAELQQMDGTPKAILEDAELMQLLLPTIKADFMLLDFWQQQNGPQTQADAASGPKGAGRSVRLSTPIHAMAGRRDAHCSPQEAALWQDYTDAGFDVMQYNGSHFFLQSHEAQVVRDIRLRLEGLLHGA